MNEYQRLLAECRRGISLLFTGLNSVPSEDIETINAYTEMLKQESARLNFIEKHPKQFCTGEGCEVFYFQKK